MPFLVTILHRPLADGAGQPGQDFLRGREEATEKDDSKELQNHHLQKIPWLARETSEETVRRKTLRSDPSVFMRKEVRKGIPPLLFIWIKGDSAQAQSHRTFFMSTHMDRLHVWVNESLFLILCDWPKMFTQKKPNLMFKLFLYPCDVQSQVFW